MQLARQNITFPDTKPNYSLRGGKGSHLYKLH